MSHDEHNDRCCWLGAERRISGAKFERNPIVRDHYWLTAQWSRTNRSSWMELVDDAFLISLVTRSTSYSHFQVSTSSVFLKIPLQWSSVQIYFSIVTISSTEIRIGHLGRMMFHHRQSLSSNRMKHWIAPILFDWKFELWIRIPLLCFCYNCYLRNIWSSFSREKSIRRLVSETTQRFCSLSTAIVNVSIQYHGACEREQLRIADRTCIK